MTFRNTTMRALSARVFIVFRGSINFFETRLPIRDTEYNGVHLMETYTSSTNLSRGINGGCAHMDACKHVSRSLQREQPNTARVGDGFLIIDHP